MRGILVLTLLLGGAADAAEKPQPLPQLSSTTMTVPWDDFRKLWDAAAQSTQREKKVEDTKKTPPPVPWSIADAEFAGEATGADSIRFQGTMHLSVLDERAWSLVPILGKDAAPIRATLNGEPYGLTLTKEGWHGLVIEKPGEYTVTVDFLVATAKKDGEVSFSFGVPRMPVTRLNLRIPDRDVTVHAAQAAIDSIQRGDDGLYVELAYLTGESIALTWTEPAPIAAVAEEVEVETRISAVTSTLTTVSDQFILCNADVQIDVLRGTANAFQFTLPNDANVIDVSGQGIAWTAAPGEAQQTVDVSLNHDVEATYVFNVQYELPLEQEFGTVRVPLVKLVDVARESGFLAVAATANVELGPGPEIIDLTRLDNRELPSILLSRSTNPILLAFKYPSGNPSLTLDIRKLQDEPVRGASIERTILSTMVTDQGYRVTRAHYDVRNNIKQFLKLDIEGDIDIWNAEVGGLPVKPARDTESDAILIPLFKSAVVHRSLESFPVELLYVQKAGEQYEIEDTLDFVAPMTDIPVGKLYWNVLLPDDKDIAESSGDLEPLKPKRSPYDTVDLGRAGVRPVVRYKTEDLYALREGIERFLITDINNPAASAVGQMGHGFDGAGEGGKGGTPPPPDPRREGLDVAGLLPMRADFDMEGTPHQFKRLIVPVGKPMRLTVHLRDREFPPDNLRERVWLLAACAGLFPIAAIGIIRRKRIVTALFLLIPVAAGIAAAYYIQRWDLAPRFAAAPFVLSATISCAIVLLVWRWSARTPAATTESQK